MIPFGRTLNNSCQDCGATMVLRKGKYGPFYSCVRFPDCRGSHGATSDGEPLGIPADIATRKKRSETHAQFDPLWKGQTAIMNRRQAYRLLAQLMGLPTPQAHIGMFSIGQCEEFLQKLKSWKATYQTVLQTKKEQPLYER